MSAAAIVVVLVLIPAAVALGWHAHRLLHPGGTVADAVCAFLAEPRATGRHHVVPATNAAAPAATRATPAAVRVVGPLGTPVLTAPPPPAPNGDTR